MATGKSNNTRSNSGRSSRSGSTAFLPFLLGFLFALVVLFAGGWAYLKYGRPPVAVTDPSFPFEADIVHVPLGARIDKEMQQPPFGISEDVYETGATVYKAQCASCHGTPGHDIPFAKDMYPNAPQLWKKHTHGNVVGVSDDEPGETYWKVKNGIRLTGMPAFQRVLSNDEMWDVTLLVKNADQQLPDPVTAILKAK